MSVSDSAPAVASGARLLLRLFLPFALGYFLSYLFRVINAVIAPDLVAELALGPADLGLLTAAYFLTFAAFQLPLGVLLDHYGARRVEGALLLFAAAGAWVFATAETVLALAIGRGLIGFGVSACLMAAFKAFVDWLPPGRLPLANGVQMAAGGLGALSATAPVELLLQLADWRALFAGLAVLSVAIALCVWFVVPERRARAPAISLGAQLHGLAAVAKSAVFWRLAPMTVASQASFLAIQGLWAGPWLREVAGMERGAAAGLLLAIAAAMVAGFLTLGAATERLARRGIPTATLAASGMWAFTAVQAVLLAVPAAHGATIWVLFGFFGTTGILTYAALSQSFPRELAGRANTSLNLLVFLAAFVAQWGIGVVIELWARWQPDGGLAAGYRAGFGLMLLLQLAGLAWFALFRRGAGRGAVE